MKATKEVLENKNVKLTITVDPEEFEKGMEKSYIKNKKSITVPGFRKGKVPRKIIERYYGKSFFYEDAINEIFPSVYEEAVKETGIDPVDRPELDIEQIGGGQDLVLSVEVTVKPEVELGQYKGIEVQKEEYIVTDHEIDHQLEHVREDNARWVAAEDRAVKHGDRVSIDYSGSVDGVQFPGGTAENYTLEIGSGNFIPGFEEQVEGMLPGEEKDINVTFPEEYHAEDLKGKEAVFHVKLHEIKEKELPELDDDFAKDVSDFSTLDEYKSDLRTKLQDSADQRSKSAMENELIKKIADNAKAEIPNAMVEREIDGMVRDMDYRLRYNGLDLEKYLKMTNTSLDDFRAQYKDDAYNRVKTQLVLEAITKAEGVEATEEDIEKEYLRLAEQYKRDIEEIKKTFGDNRDYIKNDVQIQKTIDLLMADAVFTEKKEQPESSDESAHEHGHEHGHDHEHHHEHE